MRSARSNWRRPPPRRTFPVSTSTSTLPTEKCQRGGATLGRVSPSSYQPLSPPIVKPGDPYYDDESCQVEEEIPPSWQLENKAGTDKEINAEGDEMGKEEEALPQQFANHLVEEHIELLFEIRQKQDDQVHSQSVLSQRMDILFEALTDAPAQARCPTCKQRFTPAYTIHGQPGPAMD
jgi:hypothetical protein